MTADARLVAIRLRALQATHPPEHFARMRRLDLAITDDGRPRLDRGAGFVPDGAVATIDADQVYASDGSTTSSLSETIAAIVAAKVITQTPDVTFTAEQALSALATGILKVTTGTGILSHAVGNTDYLPVAGPTATGFLTTEGLFKVAGGSTPSLSVGAALGTGGSVGASLVWGFDGAAELSCTAGTAGLGVGAITTVTFAVARAGGNYAPMLQELSAGAKDVGLYVSARSGSSFTVSCRVAPTSGLAIGFGYVVVGTQ